MPPLKGTGLSFRKTPAYWKVVGVMPGSPAAAAGVHQGDLVTRINGEPAGNFDPARYDLLVSGAQSVNYTFIEGTQDRTLAIGVASLVP